MTGRIILAVLAGIIGMGGVSFSLLAAWFNGKEPDRVLALFFTGLTGAIVGAIVPRRWKIPLLVAFLPLVGLTLLLLLGGMESASSKNNSAIATCLFLALVLTATVFSAAHLCRSKESEQVPPKI